MKYFELTCLAYLKQDITFDKTFETLSKYISFSMAQSPLLLSWHNKEGFKNYSFGNFFPIEKEKIYGRGENYTFVIRSFDEDFINIMAKNMRENINNPYLQVIDTRKRFIKQTLITELYTLTPTISTLQSETKSLYWTMQSSGDIMQLQKQLHDNLEKKYESVTGKKIATSSNFIQLLELKNSKPQTIKIQKDGNMIRFFGNKFRIIPNEDEISQKLAFVAMACGLGEKNSFGGGFCLSREMR